MGAPSAAEMGLGIEGREGSSGRDQTESIDRSKDPSGDQPFFHMPAQEGPPSKGCMNKNKNLPFTEDQRLERPQSGFSYGLALQCRREKRSWC